ncbi:S-adenosylmethionine decarboxylase proenzyme [candidate division KSB1 bacterium]|nr:MAG: S-adenosylmethionine decarboxylase proenzyme [candidate division KSB1 bacterium]
MKALGRQIVVEYYGCNPVALNNVAFIKRAMRNAAEASGATIVQEAFHVFNPHGVSGVVVIAESHLTIHTWPEYGYAAVDLFTCGDDVNPDSAFEHLKSELEAGAFNAFEMKRGILDVEGHVPVRHKPFSVPAEA